MHSAVIHLHTGVVSVGVPSTSMEMTTALYYSVWVDALVANNVFDYL